MQLKPFKKNISTKAEYTAALRAIAALVDKGDTTTREETAYLDLLGTLVEDYERRNGRELEEAVARPVTPVEAIRWAMDRHGLRRVAAVL